MKKMVFVVLWLGMITFSAYSSSFAQSCSFGLSPIIATLNTAKDFATSGDQESALRLVSSARVALQDIESRCALATEVADAISLPQEFVMKEGAYYRINYPDGWQLVQHKNLLTLISVPGQSSVLSTPQAGVVEMTIVAQTWAEFLDSASFSTSANSLASMIQEITDPLKKAFPTITYSDPVEFTTPHYQGASVDFVSKDSEGTTMLVDLGAYAGLVEIQTAPGELAQWKPTILAMVNSIQAIP